MVTEMKAKVVYRELLKEDLVIIRLVPENGMPEYKTGQFLTIGLPIPAEKKMLGEHIQLHHMQKIEIISNL